MVFNTLNLIAGYLLRKDAPAAGRPYRAALTLIRLGVVFAAVNFVLLFVGAPSWGWKYVGIGWGIVVVGIAIYYYRAWSDRRVAASQAALGARAK
jgi:O-antigen/teichoic acid export membrane protein